VFAFAGLLGWNAFNTTVTKSSQSLVQQSAMVQKVYFPRLALPISVVPGAVLDFVVSLGLMAVLMAINDVTPTLNLLTLPAWLILMLMFGLGVGFVAGALMVSYRDVVQILPVAVQMLLYISPVAYSLEAVPADLQSVFSLNPLVGVLEGFRWALLSTTELELGRTAYSVGMAVVVLVGGVLVFRRLERRFADVV
jgi:lipopolysaccharide transport system permease protein